MWYPTVVDSIVRRYGVRVNLTAARRHFWDYTRGVLRGHPGVRIGHRVKLSGPGTYRLARGSFLSPGVRVWVGPGAVLSVGAGSKIGPRSLINVAESVTIGPDTEISWDTQIMDTDFHIVTGSDGQVRAPTRPIVLGSHVLVGTSSLILKGVVIGDGAIVGAGSVVRGSVAAQAIVAGNPAEVVGHADSWGPLRS